MRQWPAVSRSHGCYKDICLVKTGKKLCFQNHGAPSRIMVSPYKILVPPLVSLKKPKNDKNKIPKNCFLFVTNLHKKLHSTLVWLGEYVDHNGSRWIFHSWKWARKFFCLRHHKLLARHCFKDQNSAPDFYQEFKWKIQSQMKMVCHLNTISTTLAKSPAEYFTNGVNKRMFLVWRHKYHEKTIVHHDLWN